MDSERETFDTLVRAHQEWVQRFASRMLGGNAPEGSAIAVEAFLRLWKQRRLVADPRPWLARTTYRLCLDALRGQPAACMGLDESLEGLPIDPEQNVLSQAVRRAVSDLPETQRAVLILSVYEQMSYEEISRALAIPIGTVGSRKNLAIASLRRSLAAWEEA